MTSETLVASGSRLAATTQARESFDAAQAWLRETAPRDQLDLEAGARRFALTIGRSLELALLCHHAQWCKDERDDTRSVYAARRFASHGTNMLTEALGRDGARALLFD